MKQYKISSVQSTMDINNLNDSKNDNFKKISFKAYHNILYYKYCNRPVEHSTTVTYIIESLIFFKRVIRSEFYLRKSFIHRRSKKDTLL